MPTLPPGPPSPTAHEPHQAREAAESFGSDPARYDRTRPRYPESVVEAVAAASPGPDVLDVGIGTGIAARQLRAAGCRVAGVEVDARMAEFARREGFDVDVSRFEDWDPAGRTFDTVVSATTWHWVDPVAGAAKAAQVLRPGGRLALLWNVFQAPPDVAAAFTDVHRQVLTGPATELWEKDALETYSPIFASATDGIRRANAFAEPVREQTVWEQTYRRDEWLEQLRTHGGAAWLSPERLDALVAGIGAAVDALGGAFTMSYTTVAVTATRRRTG